MTELNPWHPITNALDLKYLGKLGEELGECSAAVSRCIIQGIDGEEPMTGVPNRVWLENEIADVLANIDLVAEHFELDLDGIATRSAEKQKRLKTWHQMLKPTPEPPEEIPF